jgi:hypothetical protein
MNCNEGKNNFTIDLEKEQDGIYYILLTANNKVYKAKLIKNN